MLMGKGKRINQAVLNALKKCPNEWLTAKDISDVMTQISGVGLNGKIIARRIVKLEDMVFDDGYIVRKKLSRKESSRLLCRYQYMWVNKDNQGVNKIE